jgi:hypothetical protein
VLLGALCWTTAQRLVAGRAWAAGEGVKVRARAIFPEPLLDAKALAGSGAVLRGTLRLANQGAAPVRILTVASVAPELLDSDGRLVAFSGGANLGRVPRPSDTVLVPAGGLVDLAVQARLWRTRDALHWSGGDLLGEWPLAAGRAPWRLRLVYRAPPTASGAWPGACASQPLRLPIEG